MVSTAPKARSVPRRRILRPCRRGDERRAFSVILPAEITGAAKVKPQPLTDAEFERLSGLLRTLRQQASDEPRTAGWVPRRIDLWSRLVPPSEYLPQICGDDMLLRDTIDAKSLFQEFLSLIMRHWNNVAYTLRSGDVFLPILVEDESGIARANEWAKGFLRAMELRKADWAALLGDEDHGGWLVPIFALAHQNDPDPEMRPYDKLISPEL